MVSGPQGEAHLVEEGAKVVVVDALHVERERAGAVARAVKSDAVEFAQQVGSPPDECVFVSRDLVETQFIHKVDRRSESNAALNVGCAGFKFERRLVVGRLFKGDFLDHLAPSPPRWKFTQKIVPSEQDSHPGRSVNLVAGKGVEIATKQLHINLKMGNGLCTIDESQSADRTGPGANVNDFIDRPEGVRDVVDGDQSGPLREEILVSFEVEFSIVEDGDHLQSKAEAFAEHLPRHSVGVVFKSRDDDLVPFLEPGGATEGGGHEVDRVGGAAGEDDLLVAGGVEVSGDRGAGGLVGSSRSLRESMNAAVDVGIDGFVVISGGIEDREGFLGGGSIVEIDERPSVDLLVKDWESGAQGVWIQ